MSASVNVRNCKKEMDKQIIATDDREIMKIFVSNCAESRSSFKCDKLCGSKLADGNIPEAIQQVSDFRNYVRVPNTENVNYQVVSIRDHRTPEYITRGYLSLAIDGAGAQASNYSPRYSTSEKNEPERQEMLKIKSTYVKVHNSQKF